MKSLLPSWLPHHTSYTVRVNISVRDRVRDNVKVGDSVSYGDSVRVTLQYTSYTGALPLS
jgi:hypothetical protein